MSPQERPTVPREAELEDTPAGRRPVSDGWFVLNATESVWSAAPGWGRSTNFEPDKPHWFPDFGINLHTIDPGDRSTMYHSEETQEDFLVVAGECTAIVEGREVPLKQWDLLHCPPWTRHGFVNTGAAPCTILMVGARRENRSEAVEYPVDETALRLEAGVREFTTSPDEAYAGTPDNVDVPYRQGTLPGA
jgi:uncharacterized cupin superfamily protein